MRFFIKINTVALLLFFCSCGSYFNQPISQQAARMGELTRQSENLRKLPEPVEKVVVGVYNFRDQTGQYKPVENTSTFSTAVTQGATTILLKALEDSEWFTPIERENLNSLNTERQIINNTRKEYTPQGQVPQKLKPLLFAGILLEGGIISYDSNIITGGAGARYFGAGGSIKYREDRITVYLRAVSTATGEILKTVYVSKTILSQGVDAGLFRFVNFQRLLEVETGYTKNEPAELAVKEAIEKAVENLIYEGIKDNIWSTKDGTEKDKELVDAYLVDKELEESTQLYDRLFIKNDHRSSLNFSLGSTYINGDYGSAVPDFKAQLGYKYHFTPSLSLGFDVQLFRLNSTALQRHWWLSENLNFEYKILPHDRLSPYIYVGPGIMNFVSSNPSLFLQELDSFFKIQYGAGFEYSVTDRFSVNINGEYNLTFSDKIDNVVNGRQNDSYYNFGVGVNYKFGNKKIKNIENQ